MAEFTHSGKTKKRKRRMENDTINNSGGEIMTKAQLAGYLQCSKQEIPKLEANGLKSFCLTPGGRSSKKYYRKVDVEAYVDRLVNEQNAPVEVHPRALEIAQGLHAPRRGKA